MRAAALCVSKFLQKRCPPPSRSQEQDLGGFVSVNSRPHMSHFSQCCTPNDTHTRGSSRKFGVRTSHSMSHLHAPMLCVDSLRLLHFPLFAVCLLSYHPVFPPGHQLHLPRCGGQIPCELSLMGTLALLPSTTLSQVMSPTTTTSRRLLNCTPRNPRS